MYLEKKIFKFGLGLIVLGTFCNTWTLSILFSHRGITNLTSKIGIGVTQAFLIGLGLMIISKKASIAGRLKQRRSKKETFFIVIIIFGILFITFLIPEIFLRCFKPQQTYSRLAALVKAGIYIPGDFIPFTLKASSHIQTPSMEYPGRMVDVSTNSLGLRGYEVNLTKSPGTKRILVLGDSYTYGTFVGDNETYCAVLENLLQQENRSVEVINAGYADGWSPDEHYAWLVNTGLNFQPDYIIYGFFIGNDIDVKDLVWEKVDSRGLPVNISNPKIYIDQNGMIRSRIDDEKTVGQAGIYRLPILRESHLAIFLYNRIPNLLTLGNRSREIPGWGGDPFPYILKSKSDERMVHDEERFKKLVKGMADVSSEHHVEFLLLMIPVNFQVDPQLLPTVVNSSKFKIQRDYFEELKPWLNQNHIAFLDLLEAMKSYPEKRYFPLNAEVHFNPNGHKFTAEQLRERFMILNWL